MVTRFLKYLLILAIVAALAACGGNGTPSGDMGGGDAVQDAADVQHPGDTTADSADVRPDGVAVDTKPGDTGQGDNGKDEIIQPDDVETGDSTGDTGGDAADDQGASDDSVMPDARDDTTGPADTAGSDTTESDAVEQPSPSGRILIALTKSGSSGYGTEAWVDVEFYDAPMRMDAFGAYTPGMYVAAMQEGDCVLYLPADRACNPACDWDQYCNAMNKCETTPGRISAGKLMLLIGAVSFESVPTGTVENPYWYSFEGVSSGLIHSGNNIIASAAGFDGGVGPFEMSTTGVDAAEFSVDAAGGSLKLNDAGENVVSWTVPKGDTTGLFVEMVLNSGWHGSPPEVVLYCRKDAAAGSFTIPLAMVKQLPRMGCAGLFQHGSILSMSRQAVMDVDGREIQLLVSRRHGFYPTHNDEVCR